MKILYFANALDVHDVKWMTYFSHRHDCRLVLRSLHFGGMSGCQRDEFNRSYRLPILGELPDFSLARPLRTLLGWYKLRKILNDFQPDIVHVMFAEPNALWSLTRILGGLKASWILTTRGTDILVTVPKFNQRGDRFGRFVHWLYRRAFAGFEALAATSKAQIEAAQNDLGYRGRVAVVRTGVDVERLLQPRPDLLLESLRERPFIFFPRLMAPIYNQELSLDIIAALPKEIKSDYKMVFVDSDLGDPAYVREIRGRMDQLPGVEFEFLKRLEPEQVWELYKRAALTVMTPRSDGTPVSAMESLICGTPVVAPPLHYDRELADQMLISASWEPQDFVAQMLVGLGLDFKSRRIRISTVWPAAMGRWADCKESMNH